MSASPGTEAWPAAAARAHAEAERALLGAADAVEPPVAVRHHGAAALVDEPVDAGGVRALLGQPLGAEPAAGLLVDDRDQLQLAARRAPAGRARCATATASAAVCDFMSIAPRPQIAPSWTAPDHGSWRQSAASASTVSTCER